MRIYKFKDRTDYNIAYIIASTNEEAFKKMSELTSLSCYIVTSKNVLDIKEPIVLSNHILPF